MKTTIQLSDALLADAKRLARKEKTTLRGLVERGLRKVIQEAGGRPKKTFTLRRATYRGKGLQPHAEEGGWDRVRDLAYEGRGA
jgi:hypothetical protein